MSVPSRTTYFTTAETLQRRRRLVDFYTVQKKDGPEESADAVGIPLSEEEELTAREDKKIEDLRRKIALHLQAMEEKNIHRSNVRIYNGSLPKAILPFKVKKVVSPSEFYLQVIIDNYKSYEEIFQEMQECYTQPDAESTYSLVLGVPFEGRCYACKDFTNKTWNRVRVHKVNEEGKTARVFYLDLGKLQEVPYGNLLELEAELAEPHAQLFRAYLYDVVPDPDKAASTSTAENKLWCQEAEDFIKMKLEGKEFDGITMARSDSVVEEFMPDIICNFGVVLLEKAADDDGNMKDPSSFCPCTINAQMVDRGYGRAIGICASCKHTALTKGMTSPVYNKAELENMFLPKRNEQSSLTNEVDEITQEVDTKLLKEKAPAPKLGWLRFIKDEDDQPDKDKGMIRYFSGLLPADFADRIAQIKICCVNNMSCIIVHLQSDIEHIFKMQEALARYINLEEKSKNTSLDKIEAGMFVACQIIDSMRPSLEHSIWCRAFVKYVPDKQSDKSQKYSVILVDYGSESLVTDVQCRKLPDYFLDIPSFAHRLHLDNTGIAPTGTQGGWSKDAVQCFRRYVFTWAVTDPIYYIYRPEDSVVIEMEDWDQDIIYNNNERKWMKGKVQICNEKLNTVINSQRHHPMLRSLFHSVGVDMQYEVVMEHLPYYFFQPVLDNAIERGHAKIYKATKEKDMIHMEIVSSYLPMRIERSANLASKTIQTKLLLVKGKQATASRPTPKKPPAALQVEHKDAGRSSTSTPPPKTKKEKKVVQEIKVLKSILKSSANRTNTYSVATTVSEPTDEE